MKQFKGGTMKKALTIAALSSLILVLSTQILVAAPPPQEQLYEITSPQANAQLRGSVEIIGTARWPDFWFYKVLFASAATPNAWVDLGEIHEQQRTNEWLETWHTTSFPDGDYYLRLVIIRTDGNTAAETEPIPVQIANAQPMPTPVPEESPTPTPTIIIPTPTTAIVEQPTTVSRPSPIPTSEIVTAPAAAPEPPGGFSLPDLSVFVRQFAFGAFVTTAFFLFVGVVVLLRRLI